MEGGVGINYLNAMAGGVPFSAVEYCLRVCLPGYLPAPLGFPWWYIPRWPWRCLWPENNAHALPSTARLAWRGATTVPRPAHLREVEGPRAAATVVFAGDFMPAPAPQHVDPALRQLLASADVVVFNLETPLLPLPRSVPFLHGMARDAFEGWLEALGIRPREQRVVATFANNHSYDQDFDADHAAVRFTCERLGALGIQVVGAGPAAAACAEVVLPSGARVGFVGWTHCLNLDVPPHGMLHRVGAVRDRDWHQLKRDRRLDLLVGLPHWGYEFQWYPNKDQQADARAFLAAGFDCLVGSHPHTVQPVELVPVPSRDPALVAYSLGDFNGLPLPLPSGWTAALAPRLRHVNVGQLLVLELQATGAALALQYHSRWVEWAPADRRLALTAEPPPHPAVVVRV
jgi:hypothetical protein